MATFNDFKPGSADSIAVRKALGLVPTYLGQAATRCWYNSATVASGTATWTTGRTMHWARSDITDPILVFAGWWLNAVGNAENLVAGGTVRAAIETTLGTRIQSTVDTDVSFVNGYACVRFPGVTIKRGTKFWVDHLQQNANGILFSAYGQYTRGTDESFQFGTGTPSADMTVSGNPVDASGSRSQAYGPILVLSQISNPSFLLVGTSRVQGVHDNLTDTYGDQGYARIFGRRYGYTQLGLASSFLADYNTASKTYRNQITSGTINGVNTGVPYHSHMLNEYGINDLNSGGLTAAQLVTPRSTFAALYPNHFVLGTTLTPNTSSTDFWTTVANQSNPSAGQKILDFNNLVRAGIAGERAVLDVADALDPGRLNAWPVSRNPAIASITPASLTGTIAQNVLTVSAVASGVIQPGCGLRDTVGTATVPSTTVIMEQLTGTTGGVGTYRLNRKVTLGTSTSTLVTTGFGTEDGLHENPAALDMLAARLAPLVPALIQ